MQRGGKDGEREREREREKKKFVPLMMHKS